jgi:SAM-dependent methyltransferase
MPYCPCCQRESSEFKSFGVKPRPRAKCPSCGSLERHRLLWLFLASRPALLHGTRRLLHIAPEPIMAGLFKSVSGIQYISADLMAETDVTLDITKLPFADGTLDAVVCNHVLEHVPDDRAAMREFRRVLSPRGWAILQSPLDPHRANTFEDFSVQDPKERERLFGQYDHVRIYGRDYFDRLGSAGFTVEAVPFAQQLGPEASSRNALRREEIVLCHPQRAA